MRPAILALAVTLYVAPAQAEEPSGAGNVTEYGFDDDLVHGDLVAPRGEVLRSRKRLPRESLIRVREQFVVELLKSVERL